MMVLSRQRSYERTIKGVTNTLPLSIDLLFYFPQILLIFLSIYNL